MSSVPSYYIFNHIPKTGGTSFLTLCRHNLQESEISPHLTDNDVLQDELRLENYRLIAGHFSILAQSRFSRSRYSMTLVRHPIQTILSTYSFWRASPIQSFATDKAKELPLPEFVRYFRDSPALICNRYTHHFAAMAKDAPADQNDGSLLLDAAKHNLTAFDFLGICEEFERSARLLSNELGWRLPATVPHENQSANAGQFHPLDNATMEILLEQNQLDLELYAYALKLFHAREKASLTLANGQPVLNSTSYPSLTAVENDALPLVERNRFIPFPLSYAPNRNATIDSVSADWLPGEDPSWLEISIKYRTRTPVEDLSLGVAISDQTGKQVWGTNTLIEKLQLKTGRDCEGVASFILKFEAPAGKYFLTVALHGARRLGSHDHWIDRATFFDVPTQPLGAYERCRVKLLEFRSAMPCGQEEEERIQASPHVS